MREYKGRSIIAFPTDYTIVDVETTGLNPNSDEIIEIAAIRYRSGEQSASFQTLVKPSVKLNKAIIDLTGITDDMLADAPGISDVIEPFISFIGDDIIVGHNIGFDINFLYEASMKYLNKPIPNDHINTLRFANKLLPNLPNRKLGTICQHFDISTDGAHRALKDCEITNLAFQRMILMIDDRKSFKKAFTNEYFGYAQPSKVSESQKDIKPKSVYPVWIFIILIILGIVLIGMSLLLTIVMPIAGIVGMAFGTLIILYGKKNLKKRK